MNFFPRDLLDIDAAPALKLNHVFCRSLGVRIQEHQKADLPKGTVASQLLGTVFKHLHSTPGQLHRDGIGVIGAHMRGRMASTDRSQGALLEQHALSKARFREEMRCTGAKNSPTNDNEISRAIHAFTIEENSLGWGWVTVRESCDSSVVSNQLGILSRAFCAGKITLA